MSRSLASLAKRRKTIQTTQKITNAMKLVSMSKLQKFKVRQNKYDPIYDHIMRLPSMKVETDKPNLYLAFVPDLGLVSAYPRNLLNELVKLGKPDVIIYGTQSYDKFSSGEYCNMLNKRTSSETLDFDAVSDVITEYKEKYNIVCIKPEVSITSKISFNLVDTSYALEQEYDQLFEPDYDTANKAYQKVLLEAIIINTYFESKVSEYTMRRVAMEQATDNADSMLEELQLQYNRLRQEKITEEIADLTQAED